MVESCLEAYPLEGCGLVAAVNTESEIIWAYPCRNAASSSRIYELDPRDFMAAEDRADAEGLEIVGVYHSHTHTDAYPSPTDVNQAPVPSWHYLLVSLAGVRPVIRSYRIVNGNISETPVVLQS